MKKINIQADTTHIALHIDVSNVLHNYKVIFLKTTLSTLLLCGSGSGLQEEFCAIKVKCIFILPSFPVLWLKNFLLMLK